MPGRGTKRPAEGTGEGSGCVFCHSEEENEDTYGKMLRKSGIAVHYFCMLFSSGLCQRGKEESDGILGFLPADIKREQKRGCRLTCQYCKKKGATIGCVVSNCRRTFHFRCGRDAGGLNQFFDEFRSYCPDHRPHQGTHASVSDRLAFYGTAKSTCSICMTAVEARASNDTLRSPCCRHAWFHRDCMQRYASSAGLYFFKCPLCNNKDVFQAEMLQFGIYIPDQDAAWEQEPDAFHELLERHDHCDAPKCICPKGRKHDGPSGSRWELLLCDTCGSSGSHDGCGALHKVKKEFVCSSCLEISKTVITSGKKKRKSSPRVPNQEEAKKRLEQQRAAAEREERAAKRRRDRDSPLPEPAPSSPVSTPARVRHSRISSPHREQQSLQLHHKTPVVRITRANVDMDVNVTDSDVENTDEGAEPEAQPSTSNMAQDTSHKNMSQGWNVKDVVNSGQKRVLLLSSVQNEGGAESVQSDPASSQIDSSTKAGVKHHKHRWRKMHQVAKKSTTPTKRSIARGQLYSGLQTRSSSGIGSTDAMSLPGSSSSSVASSRSNSSERQQSSSTSAVWNNQRLTRSSSHTGGKKRSLVSSESDSSTDSDVMKMASHIATQMTSKTTEVKSEQSAGQGSPPQPSRKKRRILFTPRKSRYLTRSSSSESSSSIESLKTERKRIAVSVNDEACEKSSSSSLKISVHVKNSKKSKGKDSVSPFDIAVHMERASVDNDKEPRCGTIGWRPKTTEPSTVTSCESQVVSQHFSPFPVSTHYQAPVTSEQVLSSPHLPVIPHVQDSYQSPISSQKTPYHQSSLPSTPVASQTPFLIPCCQMPVAYLMIQTSQAQTSIPCQLLHNSQMAVSQQTPVTSQVAVLHQTPSVSQMAINYSTPSVPQTVVAYQTPSIPTPTSSCLTGTEGGPQIQVSHQSAVPSQFAVPSQVPSSSQTMVPYQTQSVSQIPVTCERQSACQMPVFYQIPAAAQSQVPVSHQAGSTSQIPVTYQVPSVPETQGPVPVSNQASDIPESRSPFCQQTASAAQRTSPTEQVFLPPMTSPPVLVSADNPETSSSLFMRFGNQSVPGQPVPVSLFAHFTSPVTAGPMDSHLSGSLVEIQQDEQNMTQPSSSTPWSLPSAPAYHGHSQPTRTTKAFPTQSGPLLEHTVHEVPFQPDVVPVSVFLRRPPSATKRGKAASATTSVPEQQSVTIVSQASQNQTVETYYISGTSHADQTQRRQQVEHPSTLPVSRGKIWLGRHANSEDSGNSSALPEVVILDSDDEDSPAVTSTVTGTTLSVTHSNTDVNHNLQGQRVDTRSAIGSGGSLASSATGFIGQGQPLEGVGNKYTPVAHCSLYPHTGRGMGTAPTFVRSNVVMTPSQSQSPCASQPVSSLSCVPVNHRPGQTAQVSGVGNPSAHLYSAGSQYHHQVSTALTVVTTTRGSPVIDLTEEEPFLRQTRTLPNHSSDSDVEIIG